MHRFGAYLSCFLAGVILFLGISIRNPFFPIKYPGYFISTSEGAKQGKLTGFREIPLVLGRATMSIPKGPGKIVIQSTVLTATSDCLREWVRESGFSLRLMAGTLPENPGEVAVGSIFAVAMGLQPGMEVFMAERGFKVTGVFAKTGTILDTVAISPGPPPPNSNHCYYIKPEKGNAKIYINNLDQTGLPLLEDPFHERKMTREILRFQIGGLLFGIIIALIGGYFSSGLGAFRHRRIILALAITGVFGIAIGVGVAIFINLLAIRAIGIQKIFKIDILSVLMTLVLTPVLFWLGWLVGSKKNKEGTYVPPVTL